MPFIGLEEGRTEAPIAISWDLKLNLPYTGLQAPRIAPIPIAFSIVVSLVGSRSQRCLELPIQKSLNRSLYDLAEKFRVIKQR